MIDPVQAAISVFSLSSIAVSYFPGRDWRRYGCLLGFCAQPFWVWMIVERELYGILPLTPAYTAIYCVAIWDNWIRSKS